MRKIIAGLFMTLDGVKELTDLRSSGRLGTSLVEGRRCVIDSTV